MCAEHAHAYEHDDLVPTALFSCLLAVVPVLNGERQEP